MLGELFSFFNFKQDVPGCFNFPGGLLSESLSTSDLMGTQEGSGHRTGFPQQPQHT